MVRELVAKSHGHLGRQAYGYESANCLRTLGT